MNKAPTREHISVVRWLAIVAGASLYLSENLNLEFEVWKEPVNQTVYWIIGAIAVGVDAPTLRRLLIAFFETITRGGGK